MATIAATATKLIGRDLEQHALSEALRHCLAGTAGFVFVSGEAGIGKTALVDRLTQTLPRQVRSIGLGQCIEQYGSNEPYLPLLQAATALCQGENSVVWRDSFWRFGPSWLMQMPGLVEDGDWDLLERRVRATTSGRMLRELGETLQHGAKQHPTLVVLEDLHCCDQATLQCLRALMRRSIRGALLVVATFRPEEAEATGTPLAELAEDANTLSHCTQIQLKPLSPEETKHLVRLQQDPKLLADEFVMALHRRSEGNPLFLGQLLDHISGSEQRVDIAQVGELLPNDLQASILRQLQRLPDELQALLRAASVAGTEFLGESLARALKTPVLDIERQLQSLSHRRHFVARLEEVQIGGSTSGRYRFRHSLYKDAIYSSLPDAERQTLHRQMASGLLETYAGNAAGIAGQIAAHAQAAGDRELAASYMLQAGVAANRRTAFVDSVGLLGKALEYLEHLPKSPKLDSEKLRIQIAMVPALLASRGYASEELEQLCLNAVRGGALHDPKRFPIVNALRTLYFVRAQYAEAAEFGQRVLDAVLASQDKVYLTAVLKMAGDTRVFCGTPAKGCKYLDDAIAAYDAQRDKEQAYSLGVDTKVSSLAYSALAKWLLGCPEQALARSEQALTLAEQIGHPHTLGVAYVFSSAVQVRLGDYRGARETAEALRNVSHDYGLPPFAAWAQIRFALVDAVEGDASALDRMEQGLELRNRTGEYAAQSLLLAEFAEAALAVNNTTRAQRAIEQGLDFVRTSKEISFEPELLRLRGELALRGNDRATERRRVAEADFRSALERARQLGALGLALRAATSLAELKGRDAGRELEHCYDGLRGHPIGSDARRALGLLRKFGLREATLNGEVLSQVPISTRTSRKQRRFRLEGDYWTLVFDGSVARVKNSKGMNYLAKLLDNPNQELHALDLVAAEASPVLRPSGVLDARAKDSYRKRYNEIKQSLGEAESNNDQAQVERLKLEQEWLRQQLAQAFGLGGRSRSTGSAAERARVSATRAIKKALQRIQEAHPALGEHLHRNLRTGQFCCYDPDQELRVTWTS